MREGVTEGVALHELERVEGESCTSAAHRPFSLESNILNRVNVYILAFIPTTHYCRPGIKRRNIYICLWHPQGR